MLDQSYLPTGVVAHRDLVRAITVHACAHCLSAVRSLRLDPPASGAIRSSALPSIEPRWLNQVPHFAGDTAWRKIRARCRRGHLRQARRSHLVVPADRAVVQPGSLQRGTHLQCLVCDLCAQLRRARLRPPRSRLQHRRRPVDDGTCAQLVERLREMPCSAQKVETAPRGTSSGHYAIARRTRGSMRS